MEWTTLKRTVIKLGFMFQYTLTFYYQNYFSMQRIGETADSDPATHFNSSGSPIHFYSFGSRHSFLFIRIPPFIFIHPDPAIHFIHSDPAIIFIHSDPAINFYSSGSRHSFLFIRIQPFIFIHSDPAIHFDFSGSGSECKFGSVQMAIFVLSYSYLILACLMPQRKLQHLGLPQLQLLNK